MKIYACLLTRLQWLNCHNKACHMQCCQQYFNPQINRIPKNNYTELCLPKLVTQQKQFSFNLKIIFNRKHNKLVQFEWIVPTNTNFFPFTQTRFRISFRKFSFYTKISRWLIVIFEQREYSNVIFDIATFDDNGTYLFLFFRFLFLLSKYIQRLYRLFSLYSSLANVKNYCHHLKSCIYSVVASNFL